MKRLIAVVAVFAVATNAYAAEFEDFTNIPSTKTRAEVLIELNALRAQRQVTPTEFIDPAQGFVSSMSRPEVVIEHDVARIQTPVASAEWVEPTQMSPATNRTREEVRAETIAALKNGRN